MSKFSFLDTGIKGLKLVEPTVFGDERGYFMETYHEEEFSRAGLDMAFVQDNQSSSTRGVLRGLHYQRRYPQGKLVRVIKGEVFDAAVDIRKDSDTFGKSYGTYLSDENKHQLYIPEGFAHGFLVLSDTAEFVYKCTDFYHPEDQGGILWNDQELGIQWPLDKISNIVLSEKDKKLPSFSEYLTWG